MVAFSYKKRIADDILDKYLHSAGAVLIKGPKWCGKTTTAEQQSNSILYVSDPKDYNKNLITADMDIYKLLYGDKPRLLDEWQTIPQLWDAVRFSVDHSKGIGQYILTGSASPLEKGEQEKIHHTGTGRIIKLDMRPMSLWESGESNGCVSVRSIFENADIKIFGESTLELADIAFLICRGGWPISATMENKYALNTAISYFDAIVEDDISKIDGISKNTSRVKRLMRSLARHQGTQATLVSIKNDMKINDVDTLDETTVANYIEALKKLYVVEDMEAWNPNLRSKASIRTSDTRYFIDPSIASASLGIGPDDLTNDLNTMGLLFETLAVRDLRVYADALDGKVYHYRDSNGLECDSVIHLRNGKYGLVEIKLGGEKLIAEGAHTLNKFDKTIDSDKMNKPSFKMVLTAVGKMAYRRNDGVYVVPIGCLKP